MTTAKAARARSGRCGASSGSAYASTTAAPPAKVAVLGASGYTGADVARLAVAHGGMELTAMVAERSAGQKMESVFPHLRGASMPSLAKLDDVDWSQVDAAFACLPHALTQEIVAGLPKHIKVVDLSADFRLRDVDTYAKWYGGTHLAKELQKEAVYGLTELKRDLVREARLVANPGCYPTCSQLPLVPLLEKQMISIDNITIDAKSGVSGAGRAAKEASLYCEVAGGMHAYGVGSHRHMPEIEQELSDAAGVPITISFTPHLIPMSRGMQCTIYVNLEGQNTVDDLRVQLDERYRDEKFVIVLEEGQIPHTRHVKGSNYCVMNVFPDRIPGRAIIVSVIDNLVKGASGQAMQNMNLVLGLPEEMGLMQEPMFP